MERLISAEDAAAVLLKLERAVTALLLSGDLDRDSLRDAVDSCLAALEVRRGDLLVRPESGPDRRPGSSAG